MKKIIALVLALVLTVAASVAGTVAYLQAEDSDVNVMTLGNVEIEQIEQQLSEDGTKLVPFKQAKPLYPYVGEIAWNDNKINIIKERVKIVILVFSYIFTDVRVINLKLYRRIFLAFKQL